MASSVPVLASPSLPGGTDRATNRAPPVTRGAGMEGGLSDWIGPDEANGSQPLGGRPNSQPRWRSDEANDSQPFGGRPNSEHHWSSNETDGSQPLGGRSDSRETPLLLPVLGDASMRAIRRIPLNGMTLLLGQVPMALTRAIRRSPLHGVTHLTGPVHLSAPRGRKR